MKKLISIMLALVMVLALCACGSKNAATGTDTGSAAATGTDADKYVVLDTPISTEQYGIGFKKGNAALRDEVWAAYQGLLADGTVDKLAELIAVDLDA